MITDLTVFTFSGQLYALIHIRDNNDQPVVLKVTDIEGHFYVIYDGDVMNVDDEVRSYYLDEEFIARAIKCYQNTDL